jgi:hypothetical protein
VTLKDESILCAPAPTWQEYQKSLREKNYLKGEEKKKEKLIKKGKTMNSKRKRKCK